MRYRRPRSLSYQETIRFHGHDGPFLALGYRLGRHLVRTLKPSGIMGLRITALLKNTKPYTCMLDGLQCSTFATLGKGNLVVRKSSGRSVAVRVNKGRKTWTFKITLRALDICLHADDLAKSARRILRMRASDLWS